MSTPRKNWPYTKGRPLLSHPECGVCRKRRARMQALRDRWRDARLCHQCGTPCRKYATCPACRAYQAQRRKIARQRKKLEQAA